MHIKKNILLVIAARFNDLLVNDPLARLLALVIVGCNIFIHFKVICYNALDGVVHRTGRRICIEHTERRNIIA